MSQVPTHQHFSGRFEFFRLGRYYVDGGDRALSGLMSKAAAQRFRKKIVSQSDGMYGYGIEIKKCPDTANSRRAIFFAKFKNPG